MSIKELIKKILKRIMPMRNCILLSSNPVMCDNAFYVYKELLARNINDKYKLVWVVSKKSELKKIRIKNVIFVSREQPLKFGYYNYSAKYIIDCNGWIRKKSNRQFRIYLTHGSPAKKILDFWHNSGEIDVLITTSEFWTNIMHQIYDETNLVDKFMELGFPRNDTFFDKSQQLDLFPEIKASKTIMWLPTYRKAKSGSQQWRNINIDFPLGIPCFQTIEQVKELNDLLIKRNLLLIIKPHPFQDLSAIQNLNYTNIKIIYDSFFGENNLYNYLPKIDALITDYSSVYFDFLLADKPIGLAIPDKDEYINTVGQNTRYEDTFKGDIINTFEDLVTFVENISDNKDYHKYEREVLLKKYYKYRDGNSSKRVVDILVNEMNRKD